MIKVIGIVGSPRKENTYKLVEAALEAVMEEEEVEAELIPLSDLNIKHCDGCLSCKETLKCGIDDDMQGLYPKLTEADVLIIGTPTYFWNVSGLLKDFIDRSHALYESKALRGKTVAAITVADKSGQDKALSAIGSFFRLHEMKNVGNITVALHDRKVVDENDLSLCRMLGKKITKMLAK